MGEGGAQGQGQGGAEGQGQGGAEGGAEEVHQGPGAIICLGANLLYIVLYYSIA